MPSYKTIVHRKRVERFEVANRLQGESLVRESLLRSFEGGEQIRLVPDLNVVKIGGHGIMDYGKEVVLPLVEEIGDLSKEHKILVVTGGGVRVRHILDLGLDLGMPTGVLAELAGKISEQNAIMMSLLFSRWNGMRIHTADLLELPMLFHLGVLPVTHGTPPYGLYEQPAEIGTIPPHRTDTGAFLAAEVLGAKNLVLVKNVDGLYTANPFLHEDAERIPDITASELLDMNLDDMVLEKKVVELLLYAKNVHEVKIVNGHTPGNVRKVLSGGMPGTIIRAR
ncbi:MAG TPA: uridylate kinase [Methanolinea sp.]|jgi:molybdenum storage protein|nr:MAG: Uridylate kinase [Methanoregulaceae archaeon PtaB.Bin009]OPY42499.1 MAG: Uridylate kinase [Methanoregulaceae archaeon PtaU1.Bin066]HII75986.1 uridylate kinase [Methanolinea sp.]